MKNRRIPVQLPEGYVEFYKDLENWQNEKQIILQKSFSPEKYDDIPALIDYNRKPLAVIKNFSVNNEKYRQYYHELLDFIVRARVEALENMELLRSNVSSLNFEEVVDALLSQNMSYFNKLAEAKKLPVQLLVFTLDHALRPFLRVYALPYQEELREDTFHYWAFPQICPICGTQSHFSRLRSSDGRRFMFCDRCFTEWEIRYLQCVHCGNDDPGHIKYINAENDDAYQVYICENCKGYLKTYDERLAGRTTDLFIANIETIYLDMLAQEKGYRNHEQDWEYQ